MQPPSGDELPLAFFTRDALVWSLVSQVWYCKTLSLIPVYRANMTIASQRLSNCPNTSVWSSGAPTFSKMERIVALQEIFDINGIIADKRDKTFSPARALVNWSKTKFVAPPSATSLHNQKDWFRCSSRRRASWSLQSADAVHSLAITGINPMVCRFTLSRWLEKGP